MPADPPAPADLAAPADPAGPADLAGPVRSPGPADLTLAAIGDEAGATPAAQIAAVELLGWSGLELRTVDGIPLGELGSNEFAGVLRAVREAGLVVPCLASRIGNWARPITAPVDEDLRELDVLGDQADALGTRHVRIMSWPNDALPEPEWRERVLDRVVRLVDRAEQRGLVLVHENCSGWAGAEPKRKLALVDAAPAMRVLFDTGNGIAHGYDSYDVLRRVLPHVAHVHVKDAVGTPERTTYVPPGDGRARVVDCLRLLLEHGYSGALSLEPHLATRPHEGVSADDSTAEPFARAGRSLERLLHGEIRPVSPAS